MNNTLFAVQITDDDLKLMRIRRENNYFYASDLVHEQFDKEAGRENGMNPVEMLVAVRREIPEHRPQALLVLNSQDLEYKDFSFPFETHRKVRNAIDFELSTDYPEDEYVHDQVKAMGREPGYHGFIAAVAARSTLVDRIRTVEEAGFRVAGVTADISTLGAAFRDEEEALVMDTEERHTLFALYRQGVPVLLRKIPIGLSALAGQAGSGGLAQLTAEIKRTIHSFNARLGLDLDRLYATGNLLLKEELCLDLKQRVSTQIEFRPAHYYEVGVQEDPQSPDVNVFAGLLGSAFWKRKDGWFNFLREEFTAGKEGLSLSSFVRRGAFFAAVFVLLLFLSYGLDLVALRARDDFLRAEIRSTFTSAFPQVTRVVDELRQARALLDAEQAGGGSLQEDVSLLQALKDISSAIPLDVSFEIVSLFWETGKMEIQARTDSFKTVNVIQELLEGSARISQAAISNARQREEGQDVEFRLTVRLEG